MRNAFILFITYFMVIVFAGCGKVSDLANNIKESVSDVAAESENYNTIVSVGDSISTNILSGEDKKEHIANFKLSLFVENGERREKIINAINGKIEAIRDIAKNVLENRTFEELSKNGGLENLKKEILEKLKKEFDTDLISDVLVEEFFIQ